MNNIKKVTALIVVVCMMIVLLSGCTSAPEGKALYDAMVKSQSIKSSQNDMQFTFRLDAAGLNEQEEMGFAQAKAMLNGAKFLMNTKQMSNADNTVTKAWSDINMELGGILMNMGVWVGMDLNSNPPKLMEIIKLPAMLTAMDPAMAGKEYMVMDFDELVNITKTETDTQSIDYVDTIRLTKELQAKAETFLSKYLAQYEPGFKYISDAGTRDIETPEGAVKAHIYQIKLDDKAAKKLIRYTINNFADNKDAMEFTVEYIKFLQKYAVPASGEINPIAELDKLMADFEKEKPVMLAAFNKTMDEIDNIQLFGEKGISLEYAIDENGYIISQSGSIDLAVDPAKFNNLGSVKNGESEGGSVYYIGFDFNILTYNINKDLTIEFPTVSPENSIDFNDMLKRNTPDGI